MSTVLSGSFITIVIVFLVVTLVVALVQIAISAGDNRTRILLHKMKLEERYIELEILKIKQKENEDTD